MADEGEMMPIRLVKENGDTISLDATSIDIVVERIVSNMGIPFFDAKKFGIDLNQTAVVIEVQGVFADDEGQEATAQSTATIDFYQPQQIVSWGQPIAGSGGGTVGGHLASGFNLTGPTGGFGLGTGIGSVGGFDGGWSGGIGGSIGQNAFDVNDLGNRVLKYWNEKYIELPIAYWVEAASQLDNPIQTGLQLWLKADTLSSLNQDDKVASWTDSSNGRNAVQSTVSNQPTLKTSAINGKSSVNFIASAGHSLETPYNAFINTEETTVFVVGKPDFGNNPIISTEGSNKGFRVSMDASNKRAEVKWYNASAVLTTQATSINSLDSVGSTISPSLIAFTIDDTNADAEADELKIYVNGKNPTVNSSMGGFIPQDSAALVVGNGFDGLISEIMVYNRVLTTAERQQVEGYLGRKYNIPLVDTHPHRNYSYENKHVKIAFDKELVSHKAEQYGFLNQTRYTGMQINGTPSTATITVDGDDPRKWFEISESTRSYFVTFRESDGSAKTVQAQVTAVNSTQITLQFTSGSPSDLADNDQVWVESFVYNYDLQSSLKSPVIIIPIKNADTFDDQALPEKSVGPEFPAHENGDARDDGGGLTRTDEYITYLFSKAITADYIELDDDVDANGNKGMDDVFSTVIDKSYNNHNCRLTITQKYATSLGQLSDTINSTLGAGQMPVTQGFSGGRSGKRVKSGGDKVQDIIGILGNSNNFESSPQTNFAEEIISAGKDFVQQTFYGDRKAKGDFITGIQIPYNTITTRGKSPFDAQIAQRNFFLTTSGPTGDKLSSVNDVHATRLFSRVAEGHLKNGISGLVEDFSVSRDAAMKAYEFSLKFRVADIIL
jgi:hypothetical protein